MKYLSVLCLLFLLACNSGVEVNRDCWVKHTSEAVKLESKTLGAKECAFVNLTWGWIYYPHTKPQIDYVIVERSIGDSTNYHALDTLPVDTVMTYNDADTLLKPNLRGYYRLISLYGLATDTIKVVNITIPPAHKFYEPATDTIGNDTLPVTFGKLPDFENYKIELYRALTSNMDSLFSISAESLLLKLTDALFDTTITDTTLILYLPDSIFPNNEVYTIKLSVSKMLEYITDTSVGLRFFFKKE